VHLTELLKISTLDFGMFSKRYFNIYICIQIYFHVTVHYLEGSYDIGWFHEKIKLRSVRILPRTSGICWTPPIAVREQAVLMKSSYFNLTV